MTTTLNASTAGAGGFIATSDNSGILALQTGGTTAITVDASQNVGIGTASPSTFGKLAVSVAGTTTPTNLTNVGPSSVNLYAATNGGSTDGTMGVFGWNSTTGIGSGIGFSRESSSDWGTQLRFYTHPTTTSNIGDITERMRIDSSGSLILAGSTAQKATGTTWSNPSDQRLKDNIRDYAKGMTELMQVRVREWEYNGKGGTVEGTKGLGVIADEVMTVLPNTVENYDAKLNADDDETTAIKKFDATEITWLLVKAFQELKAINDTQAETINALTARIVALESK